MAELDGFLLEVKFGPEGKALAGQRFGSHATGRLGLLMLDGEQANYVVEGTINELDKTGVQMPLKISDGKPQFVSEEVIVLDVSGLRDTLKTYEIVNRTTSEGACASFLVKAPLLERDLWGNWGLQYLEGKLHLLAVNPKLGQLLITAYDKDGKQWQKRFDDVVKLLETRDGDAKFAVLRENGDLSKIDLASKELKPTAGLRTVPEPALSEIKSSKSTLPALTENFLVWRSKGHFYFSDHSGALTKLACTSPLRAKGPLKDVKVAKGMEELVRLGAPVLIRKESRKLPPTVIAPTAYPVPIDGETVAIIDAAHQRVVSVTKKP